MKSSFAGQCEVCQKDSSMRCSSCFSQYYCNVEHQKTAWNSHKNVCKMLKPFKNQIQSFDKIEISNSYLPDAGKGLIAKKDFKKGEMIALYFGSFLEDKKLDFELRSNPYHYRLVNKQLLQGNSSNDLPAFLSGQLINDPYMRSSWINSLLSINCNKPDYKLILEVARGYIMNHLEKNKEYDENVELFDQENGFPLFKATKEIEAGKEFFWPYGINYWMTIPEKICLYKGFPEVSIHIKKIIIDAVNEIPESENNIKNLYMPVRYKNFKFNNDLEALTSKENRLRFKISSLLSNYNMIQLQVINSDLFVKMLDELGVEAELENIAHLPNQEFYDLKKGYVLHSRSKKLILSMIEFQKKYKSDIFKWVDVELNKFFETKLIIQALEK